MVCQYNNQFKEKFSCGLMGLFDWFRGGKTLYFPGEMTKKTLPEIYQNYLEILKRLDIDFITIDSLKDSGMSLIHEGDMRGARALSMKNYGLFKENKISKIITNSPEVYRVLREFYPKFIKDFDIEIEHISITTLNALKDRGIRFRGGEEKKEAVTYQDSCYLGRLFGIYEEPRSVIEILGGKIVEFDKNKEDAICSGSCGGVYFNFPEIAKEAARKRVLQAPANAKKIITPSEVSYVNLRAVTDKAVEFSTFVLNKIEEIENGK